MSTLSSHPCIAHFSFQAGNIHELGEQIGTKLAKAEELGKDGNVDDSLKLLQEVEDLKKSKTVVEVN